MSPPITNVGLGARPLYNTILDTSFRNQYVIFTI